mgnify:CR=1 FL=1
MSLFDIMNSIDLSLEKNINSYDNSIIDNFLDELVNQLGILDAKEKLKKLPEDTLFTLDRYESNYAVCENRTTGKMYDIPRTMVESNAKECDILKLEGNTYRITHNENGKPSKYVEKLVDSIVNYKN